MLFSLGIFLFVIVGIIAVIPAFLRPRRIIEFPFMIGACLLVWIVPQAYVTMADAAEITEGMFFRFCLFGATCVAAGLIGYYWAIKSSKRPAYPIRKYDTEKAYRLGLTICLLGAGGHIGLWVHGPVEGPWTGWPVYFFTLTKISLAGIPLILISYLKKRQTYRLVVAILFLLPWIASIFAGGRRENTFSVVTMIIAVAILRLRWQPPRITLPLGLLGAAIVSYAFPIWRSSFDEQGFIASVKATSLGDVASKTREKGGEEFRDSVVLFEVIRTTSDHQYGLGVIDRLVKEYVPGSIIGKDLKGSFRVLDDAWDSRMAKAFSLGRVINGYTAKAGFLDAFLEFGYLGVFIFAGLGYVWGLILRPALAGDDASFHFMCLFALSPAHFVYSGIVMRLCLDLVSYGIILYGRRKCSLPVKHKSRRKKRVGYKVQRPVAESESQPCP